MILLRILAGTRASIGRFTDMKTSLGRCVPGGREGCWVEDDETRCGGKETKPPRPERDGRLDPCERRGGIYGKQGNNNKHLELTLKIQNTVNNIF